MPRFSAQVSKEKDNHLKTMHFVQSTFLVHNFFPSPKFEALTTDPLISVHVSLSNTYLIGE